MQSDSTKECIEQIHAFFADATAGHLLLVNTENDDVYHDLLDSLLFDSGKQYFYVSNYLTPNGLPNVDKAIALSCKADHFVLVGLSQALMLIGQAQLQKYLSELLEKSITGSFSGFGVVLLEHCEQILCGLMNKDPRFKKDMILVAGEPSPLPIIKLAQPQNPCVTKDSFPSIAALLIYLENLSGRVNHLHPELLVVSSCSRSVFKDSVFAITDADDVFTALTKMYPDIGGAVEKSYGTDEQWHWLAAQMQEYNNFAALICATFGATSNLSVHLSSVLEESSSHKTWLLWLGLKIYGELGNHYLSLVLKHSVSSDDFASHLYLDIMEVDAKDSDFETMLFERRKLLRQLLEDRTLLDQYCTKLGRLQKNAVYYLSDESEQEQHAFMRCLSLYDYTDEELLRAVHLMSKSLELYLQHFEFDELNTKLPASDASLRSELTHYFAQYKRQKLTNRIDPAFLSTVNQYALTRPYNKLQPRSSIVSHLDRKGTKLFFFDALGVEYLAFILAKCEEYGLTSEIAIGRCALPSITEKNKEFLQLYTDDNWCKIDSLDDLKHDNQIYNYETCPLPIHLFAELDVIDTELRKIRSQLVQGALERALVVADHGASRLAVLYGHEVAASMVLDEAGEHSGRCCKAASDPQIPCSAYEDGYAVLANYERFKGSRKANVEVHGGASLEEVLVPIIMLSKKPENLEICLVESTIILTPRVAPELTLYSNVDLHQPRLCINNEFHDGEFVADRKHAKFTLPQIKRKGSYTACVYDGEKNLSVELRFDAKKKTQEQELF